MSLGPFLLRTIESKRSEALRCTQEADRHEVEAKRLRREANQLNNDADRMLKAECTLKE